MKDNHEIEIHYHDNGNMCAKHVVCTVDYFKPIDGIAQWFNANESIDTISQCKKRDWDWNIHGPEIEFKYEG
jgi:hypothetical protein